MRLGRALALFGLFALGGLLARPPAGLADSLLAAASGGAVRLAAAEGSLWQGGGTLLLAGTGAGAAPWAPLAWQFEPAALVRGRLAWRLQLGEAPPARLELGPGGLRLHEVTAVVPARLLLAHLPQGLAGLGWGGELRLAAPLVRCDWAGPCRGDGEVRWLGASSAWLPGRPLGDYRLELALDGGAGRLRWQTTAAGQLAIEGEGTASADGVWRIGGRLRGDPALLGRLTGVAGAWLAPTADPAEWRLAMICSGGKSPGCRGN